MKNQALFSSKDKSKKLKCRLLQFLCGSLRVNCGTLVQHGYNDTDIAYLNTCISVVKYLWNLIYK